MKKNNRKNKHKLNNGKAIDVKQVQISQGVRRGLHMFCIITALFILIFTFGVEISPFDKYEFVRKITGSLILMVWVVIILGLSRDIWKNKQSEENTAGFATPVTADGSEFISNISEDDETIMIRAKKNLRAVIVFLLGQFLSIFVISEFINGVSDYFIYAYLAYAVFVLILSSFVIEPGFKTNIKAFARLKPELFMLVLPSILISVFDFSSLGIEYRVKDIVDVFFVVIGVGALFFAGLILFIMMVNRLSSRYQLKQKRKAQNPYDENYVNMDETHEGFEDEEG